MIIGSTIQHDGTGTAAFYSPLFSRGGQAATFVVDVTHFKGTPTLVITIEGRNDDEMAWGSMATFSDITAVGVASKDATDLKENLRLAFTYSAGSAGEWAAPAHGPPPACGP